MGAVMDEHLSRDKSAHADMKTAETGAGASRSAVVSAAAWQYILILCADSLTGMKEATAAPFPWMEYQCCLVRRVRNTLKYVPDKDRKLFPIIQDIYQVPDEAKALDALTCVTAVPESCLRPAGHRVWSPLRSDEADQGICNSGLLEA